MNTIQDYLNEYPTDTFLINVIDDKNQHIGTLTSHGISKTSNVMRLKFRDCAKNEDVVKFDVYTKDNMREIVWLYNEIACWKYIKWEADTER